VNPESTPLSNPPQVEIPGSPGGDAGSALARRLGLFDITMLVMGSVIGAGIFVVPHDVAALVPASSLVLAAWLVGGLISMAGGLVYAELARRRPHVGGQYAFLREAYHPALAFVYGWSLLWIIQSGGMAAVAVIFGRYFVDLVHLLGASLAADGGSSPVAGLLRGCAAAPHAPALAAALAIATVTAINCTGARAGSTAQNIFMTLKIVAILTLVFCGLLAVDGQASATGEPATPVASTDDWSVLTAFAAALVPVFFAYGGWHTTTFMAAEVRDPTRNLPRGLVLGVAGVIALYLGVNFVCLRVLGTQQLAVTDRPASAVMERALGAPGAVFLAAAIAVSTLGFLSQASLTSPRVYYAMARDGLFFRGVAWVHPRTRSPLVAVLLQGAVALVIAVSGTFHQIVDFVMSVEMTFWTLTACSLFLIRRRDRAAGDAVGLHVPGHPATTLLFAGVNLTLVLVLSYQHPWNSAAGIGIALAGVPAYFFWHWRNRRAACPAASSR
jgi:APA family basic amino acid/polyamine antiporter